MNKELKISDKSPFEKIRKFDGQGRSYWTSRELCAALGYSTYQKFSVPLAKAMRSAEADGINVDDHFNLMVEMVEVGSGACRSVENYHLTREACIFIARQVYAKKKEVQAALEYFSSVSIDFDGAECDVNCQEVVSEMEKDKIRERNREHWKRLNDEASEFYKKKMRLLDEVEDFKADASFHGNKAPHHMMYKLGTLYSKDGCRGYEFLIEYDVYEPVVGIYYGCKGLILDGNDEDGEKMFNEEWKDIRYYVTAVLENTFPGKSFTHRFKPTNNANNHTYWPFWITLHEDEDIVEVGARAVRLIRSVYEGYLENEDVEALRKRSDSRKESQKEDKIRFSADVNFTKEAYQELLEKIGRMSKKGKGKTNKKLFEKLLEKATESGYLTKEKHYEAAWRIVGNGDVKERDFQKKTNKQFVYVIILLLGYMQFYLKTLDTSKCGKENNRIVAVSPPYTHINKILMTMNGRSFGATLRKVCTKGDATSIIINAWKILQTLLDLPKDAWRIVNDTLNFPDWQWEEFKKNMRNG